MIASLLQVFWPVVAVTLAVAAAAGTRLPANRRLWRTLAAGAARLAVLAEAALAWVAAGPATENILLRDAVAWLAVAATVVLLTAFVAARTTAVGWSSPARVAASAAASLLVLAVSPIVLLLVHCTSGDCV